MRTHNYIMATIFGLLGLGALYAAIFLKATHQWFMVVIGLGMAIALIMETKKATKQQMQEIINKHKL